MFNDGMYVYAGVVDIAAVSKQLLEAVCNDAATAELRALLGQGASVHYTNSYRETPLHWACIRNHASSVEVLLSAGADVDATTSLGRTPLHIAAYRGNTECVQLLLHHTPPPTFHATDDDGNTPLDTAYRENNNKCGALILEHCLKYNIGCVNKYSDTALHACTRYGWHQVLTKLLDENIINDLGENLAQIAARTNSHDAMTILLNHKPVEVNVTNESGDSLLHVAVQHNSHAVINTLLNLKSSDVNVRNKSGNTFLHMAAKNNSHVVMKILLDHKPALKLNILTTDGDSLLHAAARGNSPDTLAILLKHRPAPNVNALNAENETPLHIAAGNSYLKCIRLLYDFGALCDVEGVKELAVENSQQEIMKSIFDEAIKPLGDALRSYQFNFKSIFLKNFLESELLHRMCQNKNFANTLQHPVVTAFIKLKESKLRFWQLASFLFTVLYFTLGFTYLYTYALCLFSLPPDFTDSDYSLGKCYSLSWYNSLWTAWIGLTPFFTSYEAFQLKVLGRKYFRSIDNLFDMIIISSSVICSPYLIMYILQLQKGVTVLAMIACSLNIMMFMFNSNIYMMMYCNALKSVIKVLVPYSVLITGFCFTLHAMYSGTDGFHKFGYSFITITMMLMGSLDNTTNGLGASITNDYIITLAVASFVILLMVVMMNLLIGVTVNITDDFMTYANSEIIKNSVMSIYNTERLLSGLKFVKAKHFSLHPTHSTIAVIHSRYDEKIVKMRTDRPLEYAVTQFVNRVNLNFNRWSSFHYDEETKSQNEVMKVHDSLLKLGKQDMENIEEIVQRKKNIEKSENDDQTLERLINDRRFMRTIKTATAKKNNLDIIEKVDQNTSERILDLKTETCNKLDSMLLKIDEMNTGNSDKRKTSSTEVETDMVEMKSDKDKVRTDSVQMKTDIAELKMDIAEVNAGMIQTTTEVKRDIEGVKTDITGVKTDIAEVKTDIKEVKRDITGVKTDITLVKTELVEMRGKVDTILSVLERLVNK